MVAELAGEAQPLLAPEMYIDRRADEDVEGYELWREKLFQHVRFHQPAGSERGAGPNPLQTGVI